MTLVTLARIAAYAVALACLIYVFACEDGYYCTDTDAPGIYRCLRGATVVYYDESGRPVDYAAFDADAEEPRAGHSYR